MPLGVAVSVAPAHGGRSHGPGLGAKVLRGREVVRAGRRAAFGAALVNMYEGVTGPGHMPAGPPHENDEWHN